MIDYLIYIIVFLDFAYNVLLLLCLFTNEDRPVFNLKVQKKGVATLVTTPQNKGNISRPFA
ncbi:MAG TPA: hypothetical protein DEG09_11630 [Marinilabiliaceae bacterium]|mgnify:CR=1 FL=1|nr:hypothetical protein [Marinilabiliaceae bacterium]HBX89247.1 hypothetical protein [Marinilabiliaceae bacterium]